MRPDHPDDRDAADVSERPEDGMAPEGFVGGSSQLVASLTPLQRRILRRQRRHGTRGSVIAMTALAVAVSVAATLLVSGLIVGDRGVSLLSGVALAVVLPLVLTPLISLVMMDLYAQIIRAHDALDVAASTDALTGISNRRHFFALGGEFFRQPADGQRLLVCMLDIDDFKAINDRHGHAAGDESLRRLATRLRDALPADAPLGRLGGDEMAAVIPVPADAVEDVLDAVRAACADVPVVPGLTVSATMGWSVATAGDDLDRVLERADGHLYRLKGRRGGQASHVRHRADDDGAAAASTSASA